MKRKLAILGAIVPVILVLDLLTKRWALATLSSGGSREFLGVPLTLAFNRGAAFGISIGDDPRWFFIPVTILALIVLSVVFAEARRDDYLRLVAAALVMSGALGNLVDRIRWDLGVVDFIGPIDLGFMDWPIFNVADSCISVGAVLLAVSFWREESPEEGEVTASEGAG